jgi:predicted deacylase
MLDPNTVARSSTVPITMQLDLGAYQKGSATELRVQMVGDSLGQIIHLPVVVIRGVGDGPVLGVTAAIHGNELNGLHIIHQLARSVDYAQLKGTLVLVPVINVPGFLIRQRYFNDGIDLNRIMPGRPKGTCSDVYAHRFMTRVAHRFQYLLDLHTASTGRINSLYVRANMENPTAAWMAMAQHPQLILHNQGADGTLRNALMERGVFAITVEVGNPQRHQRTLVHQGLTGVLNVMRKLEMIDVPENVPATPPILCERSFWMYTTAGGVLDVLPDLLDRVDAEQLVARVRDIYGNDIEEYRAPQQGVVIGRSVDPVNQTGSRILHLGVEAPPARFGL